MAHRSRTNQGKAARKARATEVRNRFDASFGPGSNYSLSPSQLETAWTSQVAFNEMRAQSAASGLPLRELWRPELAEKTDIQLPRLSLPNPLIAVQVTPCRYCDGIEPDLYAAQNPSILDYCRKCWNLHHDHKRDEIRRTMAGSTPEAVSLLFVAAIEALNGPGASSYEKALDMYHRSGSLDAPGIMAQIVANTQYPLVQGQYQACTHLLDAELADFFRHAPAAPAVR